MNTKGFFLRWLFALAVVFITYNPTGYSFFHWIYPFTNEQLPLKILTCLVMLIIYVIFLKATFRSIGLFGVFLALAVSATLIWLFIDQGWMKLEDSQTMRWLLLGVVGTILGIGVSWSHIRRKLTGQLDTDDVED